MYAPAERAGKERNDGSRVWSISEYHLPEIEKEDKERVMAGGILFVFVIG